MTRAATFKDVVWPLIFVAAMMWVTWYFPRFIVTAGLASDATALKYPAAGPIDFLALAVAIIAAIMGVIAARTTAMEVQITTPFDRLSLFLGRVTMLLIVMLVSVMFYEVIVRYVFEKPTLWANELSLWMAGFVFLLSGLYAMQQRSHIRIYLLYDILPRPVQRICDTVSVILIFIFAIAMLWGGYGEAVAKILRWETFGTAFDPPIPATLKPAILGVILLVAIQSLANLIADWNKEAEIHAIVDADEIEGILEEQHHREELQEKGHN